MIETIVAAAIRVPVPEKYREEMWQGERVYPNFLTISAPPPARHGTLLHPFFALIGSDVGPRNQGFLTSTGRYVDRKDAMKIALAARQPLRADRGDRPNIELFSEDLW